MKNLFFLHIILILGLILPAPLWVSAAGAPVLEPFNANSINSGDRLEIRGDRFLSINTIEFRGVSSVDLSAAALSNSYMVIRVPSVESGAYQVQVRNAAGVSNAVSVNIVGSGQPILDTPTDSNELQITSITPSVVGAGGRVRINGSGFLSFNTIQFTSAQYQFSQRTTSLTGSYINVNIPQNVAGGEYQVHVQNSRGTTNAVALTIDAPIPTPILAPTPTPTSTPTPSPDPNPREITYVALGDSVARGFWAFFGLGYVQRLERTIEQVQGVPVDLANESVIGATSSDLLQLVQQNGRVRAKIQRAQVITWNIGGNDLRRAREQYKNGSCGGVDNQQCLRIAAKTFQQNWNGITREIISLRSSTAYVAATDIYNPFVLEDMNEDSWVDDGGQSDFEVFLPYVQQFNRIIHQSEGVTSIAAVSKIFNGGGGLADPESLGLISFIDDYHPNNKGHELIADALFPLVN